MEWAKLNVIAVDVGDWGTYTSRVIEWIIGRDAY
jgi:hypothetical protein